jgi:polyisoprenoid-binding protein YceI
MTTTARPTRTTTWRADLVHSTIGFAVTHMVVATFRGRFERYDVTLVERDGGLAMAGSADASSIVVKDPDLAEHLRSPEFFDAAAHPLLRFASTAIEVGAGGALVLDGALTVNGLTRDVRATGSSRGPVEDPFGAIRRGMELEALIDRRDYGLDWNLPLPKGGLALDNEVRLLVDLEFTRL